MTKIDIVPTLDKEIAEIIARDEEEKLRNEYKVKCCRKALGLLTLVIPASLVFLGKHLNNDLLYYGGTIGALGILSYYIRSLLLHKKKSDDEIKELYSDESMSVLESNNDNYLKNSNMTKLFTDKYKRQIENFKDIEINEHENISKLNLKKLIKRNEKSYYRHYLLPDNLIRVDEYNAMVDSLYEYLDKYYPEINKEQFISYLFRLIYADAMVNMRDEIDKDSIYIALYYQKVIDSKKERRKLVNTLEKDMNKVIDNRECKIYEFKKRQ